MQLRRANAVFIGAHYQDTFLYDPHGIEYTGYAHILKGWLGSKHKIAKAYYQDFIHTLEGKVVLAFLDDNKDDLRYRFPRNIKQFRKLLSGGQNRPLTFVVDRAIYDLKDLQSYWDEHLYVITWEKGCGTIKWDPKGNNVETFSFMRYRNHGGDTITYRVEHYSEQWKRDTRFKRHLARLYRGNQPYGSVLSVICTDDTRSPTAAFEPILRRWVQENDILYLINEFGINQITSYAKVNYADIAETIEDRQFSHPSTRKIGAKKMTLRQKLGVKIVKHEDRQRQLQRDQQRYKDMKEKLQGLTDEDKKLKKDCQRLATSIRAKAKRLQQAAQKLNQLKIEYQQEIAHLDAQLEESPETLSRLEFLIEEKYQRLKFGPKALMDAIRISARNILGQCHDQFRPLYENYRNDHRILRELIRAPAFISWQGDQRKIVLIPTRSYQKKQKKSIENFLQKINDQRPPNRQIPKQKFSLYNSNSRNSIGDF